MAKPKNAKTSLYSVVKFKENGQKLFESIPDLWFLDEKRNFCYWPPKGKSVRLRALNQDKPDSTWALYECVFVCGEFVTYADSLLAVKRKCDEYNTSSADEHLNALNFRRKHPVLAMSAIDNFDHIFTKPKMQETESLNKECTKIVHSLKTKQIEGERKDESEVQVESNSGVDVASTDVPISTNSTSPEIALPTACKVPKKVQHPHSRSVSIASRDSFGSTGSGQTRRSGQHSSSRDSFHSNKSASSKRARYRSKSGSKDSTNDRNNRSERRSYSSSRDSLRSEQRSNFGSRNSSLNIQHSTRRSRSTSRRSSTSSRHSNSSSHHSVIVVESQRSKRSKRSKRISSSGSGDSFRVDKSQNSKRISNSGSRDSMDIESRRSRRHSSSSSCRSSIVVESQQSKRSKRLSSCGSGDSHHSVIVVESQRSKRSKRSKRISSSGSGDSFRVDKSQNSKRISNSGSRDSMDIESHRSRRHSSSSSCRSSIVAQSQRSNQSNELSNFESRNSTVRRLSKNSNLGSRDSVLVANASSRSRRCTDSGSGNSIQRDKKLSHRSRRNSRSRESIVPSKLQTSRFRDTLPSQRSNSKPQPPNHNNRKDHENLSCIDFDRRLTRIEVTINKVFVMVGDIIKHANKNGGLKNGDLPRSRMIEKRIPKHFTEPELPIHGLTSLTVLNKMLKRKDVNSFMVEQEKEYCAPSKSSDNVNMTAYLKRFITLELRCDVGLKDAKGQKELTLYRDFNYVYKFLIDVMKSGYAAYGKKISSGEVRIALRTVWGRSNQLLKEEIRKRRKRRQSKK